MPRKRRLGEDRPLRPDEGPGEHDRHLTDDSDDAQATLRCVSCGKPVYEDASRCPNCGHEFAGSAWDEDVRRTWRNRGWVVLGAVALVVLVRVVLAMMRRWH